LCVAIAGELQRQHRLQALNRIEQAQPRRRQHQHRHRGRDGVGQRSGEGHQYRQTSPLRCIQAIDGPELTDLNLLNEPHGVVPRVV